MSEPRPLIMDIFLAYLIMLAFTPVVLAAIVIPSIWWEKRTNERRAKQAQDKFIGF
jgi:hypothetical protein